MRDLYFVLNPALGIIKIGIANHVETRMQGLECACGVQLELLRVVKGAEKCEADLHDAFGPVRLMGEWFAPDDELIDLATGTEPIPAFLARKADAISEWRRQRAEQQALARAEDLDAARTEREEIARIKTIASDLAAGGAK